MCARVFYTAYTKCPPERARPTLSCQTRPVPRCSGKAPRERLRKGEGGEHARPVNRIESLMLCKSAALLSTSSPASASASAAAASVRILLERTAHACACVGRVGRRRLLFAV